jgi:FkbM family methyltransferase
VPPRRGTLLRIRTRDGWSYLANPREPSQAKLICFAAYDPVETALLRKLIRPGDVTCDIGANFGYYTIAFSALIRETRAIHGFEPVPASFEYLKANCIANKAWNAKLNNTALCASETILPIHVFPGRPSGNASVLTYGLEDYTTYRCAASTLVSYRKKHAIRTIDFIKMRWGRRRDVCAWGAAGRTCPVLDHRSGSSS